MTELEKALKLLERSFGGHMIFVDALWRLYCALTNLILAAFARWDDMLESMKPCAVGMA